MPEFLRYTKKNAEATIIRAWAATSLHHISGYSRTAAQITWSAREMFFTAFGLREHFLRENLEPLPDDKSPLDISIPTLSAMGYAADEESNQKQDGAASTTEPASCSPGERILDTLTHASAAQLRLRSKWPKFAKLVPRQGDEIAFVEYAKECRRNLFRSDELRSLRSKIHIIYIDQCDEDEAYGKLWIAGKPRDVPGMVIRLQILVGQLKTKSEGW